MGSSLKCLLGRKWDLSGILITTNNWFSDNKQGEYETVVKSYSMADG